MALQITKDTKGIGLRTQDSLELILTNDTTIGSRFFADRSDIVAVVIPEGITHIEKDAFIGCINLQHVILPESVTDIDCWGERRAWKISLRKPFTNLPEYLREGMAITFNPDDDWD
jgi:hypothetical protein